MVRAELQKCTSIHSLDMQPRYTYFQVPTRYPPANKNGKNKETPPPKKPSKIRAEKIKIKKHTSGSHTKL